MPCKKGSCYVGRFGRQASVTDIYHAMPCHAMYSSFSSCCHLPAVGPGGLRWGFFFFGWGSWLIGLRFVFGAWGGSLGASVRADVRVCLAGSGRFYLECTAGGPVVYMGRDKNGRTGQGIFSSVQFSSVTHWGRVPSVHGTCYPVLAWSIQLRAYAMPSVPVQCPRLHH